MTKMHGCAISSVQGSIAGCGSVAPGLWSPAPTKAYFPLPPPLRVLRPTTYVSCTRRFEQVEAWGLIRANYIDPNFNQVRTAHMSGRPAGDLDL